MSNVSFPDEVLPNHGNNDSKWIKVSVLSSITSVIGDVSSESEKMLVKSMIHERKFMACPITKKKSSTLQKCPRLYQMWGSSQSLGHYECSEHQCKATFQARRIDGWVALYSRDHHVHKNPESGDSQKGLPNSFKDYARSFVGQNNAAKKIIASITVLPIGLSKTFLGPLEISDFYGNSKVSKQLENFLAKTNLKRKMNMLHLQEGHDNKIGDSQKELVQWLDARLMTIEGVVNLSDEECLNNPNDIIILSHDLHEHDDGRWSHISFTSRHIVPRLRKAAQATISRKYGLMAEIDYTCSVEVDNLVQLGTVGISDCDRRFMQTIFDINKTENSVGASRILLQFTEIVRMMGGHCGKVLKDAAVALSKAARVLGLKEADCLAHKCRLKSWSGRPSGTRGSLETYLRKLNATEYEIKSLTAIMLAIDTLPTTDEWKFAVTLFELFLYKEAFSFVSNEKGMQHIKQCYFPAESRYGPVHSPMEVHSTNGLEKHWDYAKQGINIFKDLLDCGGVEAIFNFVVNQSLISKTVTEFHWRPIHNILDWTRVREYRVLLPGRFRHITIYRDGIMKSTGTVMAECKGALTPLSAKTIVIYVPNRHYMSAIYQTVLDQMYFEGNTQPISPIHREAMYGSMANELILGHAAKEVWDAVKYEKPSQIGEEDIVHYLLRRGQRINNDQLKSFGGRHKFSTKAKRKTSKVMEDENEYEKWTANEDLIESIELRKQKMMVGKDENDNSPKKVPALCVESLGNFCRVTIEQGAYTEMIDSTNDGYGIVCTCAIFRHKGTCDESKLFGWIFLNRYPPRECMPHVFEGMTVERENLLDEFCRSVNEIGRNDLLNLAPGTDPWNN